MKWALVMGGLGLLVIIVEGAITRFLPPPFCPDFGLVFVIALGLRWPSPTSGLVLAGALGFAMDLLSGSLLGQHTLLCVLTFGAALLATRQLNLSGSLPVVFFTIAVTLIYALGLFGTSSFFLGHGALGFAWLGDGIWHALANGLVANAVLAGVGAVLQRLGDDDPGRRNLALGPAARRTG